MGKELSAACTGSAAESWIDEPNSESGVAASSLCLFRINSHQMSISAVPSPAENARVMAQGQLPRRRLENCVRSQAYAIASQDGKGARLSVRTMCAAVGV